MPNLSAKYGLFRYSGSIMKKKQLSTAIKLAMGVGAFAAIMPFGFYNSSSKHSHLVHPALMVETSQLYFSPTVEIFLFMFKP